MIFIYRMRCLVCIACFLCVVVKASFPLNVSDDYPSFYSYIDWNMSKLIEEDINSSKEVPPSYILSPFNITYNYVMANKCKNIPIAGLFDLTKPCTQTNRKTNPLGVLAAEMAKVAVDEINMDDTILPESQLTIHIEDISSGENIRDIFYNNLISNIAILGMDDVRMLEVCEPVVHASQYPVLTELSSGRLNDSKYKNGTFFKMEPGGNNTMNAILDLCSLYNWTSVAAAFSYDMFGIEGDSYLNKMHTSKGINLICGEQSIIGGTVGTAKEFSDCVGAYKTTNIILLWMSLDYANHLESVASQNYANRNVTFIRYTDRGYSFLGTEDIIRSSPNKTFMEGSINVVQRIKYKKIRNLLKLDPYAEYYNLYRSKFTDSTNSITNSPQGIPSFEEYDYYLYEKMAYAYDAVYMIAKAVHYLFYDEHNSDGDLTHFGQIDVSRALKKVSFDGLSGIVDFSENKERHEVILDYYQYKSDGTLKFVGYYNKGVHINNKTLRFKTYPDTVISETTVVYYDLKDPVALSFAILYLVAMFLSIILIVFFTIFRNSRVVSSTGLLFLILYYLGTLIMAVSMLLWCTKPSAFTCTAKMLFLYTGTAMVYGLLASKLWKMFIIRKHVNRNSFVVKNSVVLKYWIACTFITTVPLIVLYIADGPSFPHREWSNTYTRYYYLSCRTSSKVFHSISLIISTGIIVVGISGMVSISYLCKDVSLPYKENIYIWYILTDTIIVAVLIFIPSYLAITTSLGGDRTKMIIRNACLSFVMFFDILMMAFPKVNALLKKGYDN